MKTNSRNKNNFLEYIPQIKHQNYVIDKKQVKLLFEHNGPIEAIVQKVFKKPRVTDVALDELGSAAWLYIDGKRNVRDIGQMICQCNQQDKETIYKRLSIFLGHLYRQKWISFSNQGEGKRGKMA